MTAKVMNNTAVKQYDAARHAAAFFWQKADEAIEERLLLTCLLDDHDQELIKADNNLQEWQALAIKADKEASAIYNDPASWEELPTAIEGLKARRDIIMAAFKDEALSLSDANELINELAEVEMKPAYDITPAPESDRLQEKLSKQWDEIKEEPF